MNKKPTPTAGDRDRKFCPVCGKQTYSLGGIHPQCALQQADAPRQRQLKARKKAEAANKPPAKPAARTWSEKKCPKCGLQMHVRKKMCTCGFQFDKA